ncbi:MAG: type II secretion system minor pseudopilin GspK [Gammaproteobacteria bacterium]|nr:type II secretion system minor pseudopilin GspK [Gammaproteobacteria bacterium]
MLSRQRQAGVALLMAVLVVVAATAISVAMLHDESFLMRKTSRGQLRDRAQQYALGLEDWARLILVRDRKDSKVDNLEEDWTVGVPGLPIEAGYLAGYIEDEQSRFNLNSLLDSDEAIKRFTRLCKNLDVDTAFIPALLDWIDEDLDVRYPDGMEDGYDGYRVANRTMADTSELLLVNHVTPEIYEQLKPHITALPGTTYINLNTMSEVVFQALEDNLDANSLTDEREENPFTSVDDFVKRMQIPLQVEGLSVDTEYFRAFGLVVQGDIEYHFETLIHRDQSGKTLVVGRSLGQF